MARQWHAVTVAAVAIGDGLAGGASGSALPLPTATDWSFARQATLPAKPAVIGFTLTAIRSDKIYPLFPPTGAARKQEGTIVSHNRYSRSVTRLDDSGWPDARHRVSRLSA